MVLMAIGVVEFSRERYKIKQVFSKESTYLKEIFEFWELDLRGASVDAKIRVFKVDYFDFSCKKKLNNKC